MIRASQKDQRFFCLCAAVLAFFPLVCDLPAADVSSAELPFADMVASAPPVSDAVIVAEPPAYPLRIEGRAIQQLTLANENEEVTALSQPGERVSLPAGKYYVREVELTGGFRCYAFGAGADDWVQVAADQTPVLKVGPPLTPQVHVQRAGRILKLDYQLLDAAGRNYVQRSASDPPRFAVFKDGQPLGSGSFEYG